MAALKIADIRNMTAEERNEKLKELRNELMHARGVSPLWEALPRAPESSAPSGPASPAF